MNWTEYGITHFNIHEIYKLEMKLTDSVQSYGELKNGGRGCQAGAIMRTGSPKAFKLWAGYVLKRKLNVSIWVGGK